MMGSLLGDGRNWLGSWGWRNSQYKKIEISIARIFHLCIRILHFFYHKMAARPELEEPVPHYDLPNLEEKFLSQCIELIVNINELNSQLGKVPLQIHNFPEDENGLEKFRDELRFIYSNLCRENESVCKDAYYMGIRTSLKRERDRLNEQERLKQHERDWNQKLEMEQERQYLLEWERNLKASHRSR